MPYLGHLPHLSSYTSSHPALWKIETTCQRTTQQWWPQWWWFWQPSNISAMIHHKDINFYLTELNKLGKAYGCYINPKKTCIITSCNHKSILPELDSTSPNTAQEIQDCLHQYFHSTNKQTGEIIREEVTDGFCLLGMPIRSEHFARSFYIDQLKLVQHQCQLLTDHITDRQTWLKIFKTWTVQKLPQLLGSDIMHSLPTDFDPEKWHGWNDPALTKGIDDIIIESFLTNLTSTNTAPAN